MADTANVVLVEILLFIFGLSGVLLLKIYNTNNEPYMDEIFHVRQTSQFCAGKFQEWDPMITTLPGMYLFAVGIFHAASQIIGVPIETACITFWMRCINVGFTMGNFGLFLLLVRLLHHEEKNFCSQKANLVSAALVLFPVLYFFSFLYYTDVGSTFFVLLMYAFNRKKWHKSSATFGVVAILFRQTNIIWVVFVAGITMGDLLVDYFQPSKKDVSEEHVQSFGFIKTILSSLYRGFINDYSGFQLLVFNVVKTAIPYVAVGIGFGIFIIVNNGIVVGDKSHHEATIHVPQLFYFFSFSLVFSFMHLLTPYKIWNFLKFLLRHPIWSILILGLMFLAVDKLTYEHEYLLADNRHYTFYVWSKIYKRHELVRFILVPGYFYALWAIFDSLQHQTIFWKMVFFLTIVLSTVPQKLLEFRYFIIPYILFRLNIRLPNYFQITLEIILYCAVNAATVYLFTEKPFKWEDSKQEQRFMW